MIPKYKTDLQILRPKNDSSNEIKQWVAFLMGVFPTLYLWI